MFCNLQYFHLCLPLLEFKPFTSRQPFFSIHEVNDLRLGSVIRHRYVDFTFVYRPLFLSALLRFSFGETVLCKLEVTISSFFM